MPVPRNVALRSQKADDRVGKAKAPSSKDKKKSKKFPVGPMMMAVFLFVVVGSAFLQIVSSAQKKAPL
eukprot:CAMPEP_0204259246 /NCGR_PEP_ID=MMETSP0468-20130131/5506_1 /ASSEMBLY_ACC=CAM_ASM_000383 /TAXON_ID=2969 /ORGANISM="Oxyrrhis marina" /LENGTH=67 /DNA_ID=CAMNT_0051233511 /DNA_START=69 /DNA_END=272 /DNA_ORIENTATION=-